MVKTKLQEIRERLHLTQIQMAAKLFKSQSAYAKLEAGTTSLKKEDIVLLVKVFGRAATDLLGDEGMSIVLNGSIEL